MTTITTRSGKGTALTHSEMDANLTNLNTSKIESVSLSDLSITASITEMNLLDMSASGSSTGDVLTSAGSGSAPAWASNVHLPYTAQSLATSGYIKLVGGVIIQWGLNLNTANPTITYPTAFPSACAVAILTPLWNATDNKYAPRVRTKSSTSMTCHWGNTYPTGGDLQWLAIGY